MRGELERVFEALNEAKVRYLVVGGMAVVLHGHLRTTQDLDLVLQLDEDNLRVALDALSALGFEPRAPVPLRSFADPRNRERWIREKNLVVFSLWNRSMPGFTLDLFAEEPFDFNVVHGRAIQVPVGKTEATVLGLADLIALKRKAGRPVDLLDVQALTNLQEGSGDSAKTRDEERFEDEGEVRERPLAWETQRREQDRHGLELSPTERLRWLEEAMETMRAWCGRARFGRPVGERRRDEG